MFRNKTIQMKLVNEPKNVAPAAPKKALTASETIFIVKDAAKVIAGLLVVGYVAKAAVDTTQEITVMAANKKFNK
jgi:hypothetical protein